ncbi:MAG: hypothetical protein F6K41_41830 [Symploca sp. SIO3E6]|nr:hypothetical protein [Caldora sp. SIO3E6]
MIEVLNKHNAEILIYGNYEDGSGKVVRLKVSNFIVPVPKNADDIAQWTGMLKALLDTGYMSFDEVCLALIFIGRFAEDLELSGFCITSGDELN